MPSTSTYDRGAVIVVTVPFSDQSGFKRRPALVVSPTRFHRKLRDVIVCPISSQPRFFQDPGVGDYPLREWQAAGLRYASTVRVSKLLSVDKQIITRALGRLAKPDLRQVDAQLRAALGLK